MSSGFPVRDLCHGVHLELVTVVKALRVGPYDKPIMACMINSSQFCDLACSTHFLYGHLCVN